MNPTDSQSTFSIPLSRTLFDVLLGVLAMLIVLNVVVSLAFLDSQEQGFLDLRREGFRLVAAWVILLSITLASHHLRNYRLAVLVLSVALGTGTQYLALASSNIQGLQATRFELTVSVFSIYFLLPTFMVLLVATKVDVHKNSLELEETRLARAQGDLEHIRSLLSRSRDRENKPQDLANEEEQVSRRRWLLDLAGRTYPRMVRVRSGRDVSTLLETLLKAEFCVAQGLIFEIQEETRSLKLKASWGLDLSSEEVLSRADEFKNSTLVAQARDRKRPLWFEAIQKDPMLADTQHIFSGRLFPLTGVLPVVTLGKTAFLIFIGEQQEEAPARLGEDVLQPYLQALGLVLAKLSVRTG